MQILQKQLIDLYQVKRKTDLEIAELLSVTKQSVYRARKRYGIQAISKADRLSIKPTELQLALIYGTLLGDGSLPHEPRGNSCLEFKHGPKQHDYVWFKYDLIKNLCPSEPKPTNVNQLRARTHCHPCFQELRNKFYNSDGEKIVPRDIAQNITALSLAIWFCDDGRNCNEGLHLSIATCSFSIADHELLIETVKKKFDLDFCLKTWQGYRNLQVENHHRRKWLDLIKPHIPSSMNYKLTDRRLVNVELSARTKDVS